MATALGIDAGLSGVKVGAFAPDGTILALAEVANDALRRDGPQSEMDMPRLWELACQGVRQVVGSLPPGRQPQAVGLCGHGNGVYLVSPDAAPLLAVSSMDTRAAPIVDAWLRDGTGERICKAVGGHVWSGQPLPILAQLGLPSRPATLLFCKDWIRHRLTGTLVTDRGDASAAGLLELKTGVWARDVFESVGLGRIAELLPDLAECFDKTGEVTGAAADQTGLRAGTPVFGGSIDLTIGALGDGLDDRESLHVTAGTWAIHQARAGEPVLPADILQTVVAPWPGEFMLVESSPTSAVNLAWLANLLGPAGADYEQWDRWVLSGGDEPGAPMYLPYPTGAWDLPSVRAALADVRPEHDAPAVVRAVYEGIVMGHRRQIAKYLAAGIPVRRLIVTGGLTRSGGWCQWLADHTGLPVEVSGNAHAACWGAAICALRGMGRPVEGAPPARTRFEPRPEHRAQCDERFARFMARLDEIKERTR
ncbi:MAG TPA: FGGY family carbohydrate kinase [Phycisphaerae bacterium]|nr:FGGY family carbohydrate kinase [Phycisphaerae bacterium]